MITIEQMKAEVDRHLAWMVRPGGPGPQKSFDQDEEEGPEWANVTFLVGGDEVSVTAEVDAEVQISVNNPKHEVVFHRVLAFGEDLEVRDREYITNLLADMGARVKFPVEEYRTRWTS